MSTSHLQNANMRLDPPDFMLNQHSDIKTDSSFSSYEEKKKDFFPWKRDHLERNCVNYDLVYTFYSNEFQKYILESITKRIINSSRYQSYEPLKWSETAVI